MCDSHRNHLEQWECLSKFDQQNSQNIGQQPRPALGRQSRASGVRFSRLSGTFGLFGDRVHSIQCLIHVSDVNRIVVESVAIVSVCFVAQTVSLYTQTRDSVKKTVD